MSRVSSSRLTARPVLDLILAAAIVGCDGSPTDSAPVVAAEVGQVVAAQVAVPPPAMQREIEALLATWENTWASMDASAYAANYALDADFVNPLGGILSGRQAIAAAHAFLFGGPFAGSVQTGQIRRLVALTGTLAIVDLDVTLTGYAGPLPPGLAETAPGVVATRARMVVGKTGSRWEILAQQLTRIAPGPA